MSDTVHDAVPLSIEEDARLKYLKSLPTPNADEVKEEIEMSVRQRIAVEQPSGPLTPDRDAAFGHMYAVQEMMIRALGHAIAMVPALGGLNQMLLAMRQRFDLAHMAMFPPPPPAQTGTRSSQSSTENQDNPSSWTMYPHGAERVQSDYTPSGSLLTKPPPASDRQPMKSAPAASAPVLDVGPDHSGDSHFG